MNVLVLTAGELFVRDAMDGFQQDLVGNLRRLGINAEAVRMPVTSQSAERFVDDMVLCRSLQLLNVDCMIALRFPAYLVPHPNKVCWLIEHWSERYDAAIAGGALAVEPARCMEIGRLLEESDRECLANLRRLFTSSPLIRDRIKITSGLDADLLPYPTNTADWDKTVGRILL